MFDVGVVDLSTELHFDGNDAMIGSLDDEIDLVTAALCSQMRDASLARLSAHSHREGHE